MESRFSDLFFQKAISCRGFGCPTFKACSGSNLRMFLIYFVHIITQPSKTWALSFSEMFSPYVSLWGGVGSCVWPSI